MDMQSILKAFVEAGWEFIFYAAYEPLAEMLSNVYVHAPSAASPSVSWELTVEQAVAGTAITVRDNGQGVYGSVSKHINKDVSSLEAIILAINQRSSAQYRGQGLSSILRAVRGGSIHSFIIESGDHSFSVTEDRQFSSRAAKLQGTRVQIIMPLGHEQ
ncbi:hypothetical protein AO242_21225 [Pseudomonas sp. ICMP 561]|nr:hypothetical protein AO242_21225 [Pseudomonas sp. ICMP 561]